ncbi:hypothetical protein [Methylotenera sp. 1P/1]|uniref:hypothetical protein n=1 Tax=Methylotenera sp. 1P/1 TaxID=1131551 RepID=UPI0003732B0D|nr:hypothetical protein [Methylotenera sp. 1P/1]
MDILNSEWLVMMLSKASKTPQGRMLALFDILENWSSAPHLDVEINRDPMSNQTLIHFLTAQAVAYGAKDPEILTDQIVLIAWCALQKALNSPDSTHLAHGKDVVKALLSAHTRSNERSFWRMGNYKAAVFACAASLALIMGISMTGAWDYLGRTHNTSNLAYKIVGNGKNVAAVQHSDATALSPSESANYFRKYEETRSGICQYQEVLSLPVADRVVYLKNVVNNELPENAKELAITNYYLNRLNCYYSPFLNAKFRA